MILHINNAKTWRGGEQQLYYLINGLKERNIPQIVIGQPDSELKSRLDNVVPYFSVKMRGEYDFWAAFKIAQIAKTNGSKLIHTHTGAAHGLGLLVKYFLPDLKLIVSRRVDFHINNNPISRRKYFSNRIDYFLTVSNRIKDVLIEDGVNPEKIITVYSGIDLGKFKVAGNGKKLISEFQIPKKTIIIGNVAALVDHKDQETLLKAIPLIETEKNYLFFIVGEGELESKLKDLAKDLNISEKVIFTGFRNDIKDFYNLFDIFTLTSKEEGLGTSVLDAMANELPIIATNGGGIGEMLEEGNGSFLASVGDHKKLAENYSKLLNNATISKKFGKINKQNVKKFSIENTIQKTVSVYNSLL